MIFKIISVFTAGILSSLSPCVYPMIPITLGYLGIQEEAPGRHGKIILFFLGQVTAFTAIGFFAVQLGDTFGFTSENSLVQKMIGFVLIFFGLISFFSYMPQFLLNLNSKTQINFIQKDQFIFPFVIGVSSALMASPCTSPILGSVLTTLSAESSERASGFILMLAYAVGASFIFLVLGLGLAKLKSLPRAGRWMNSIHRLSSLLMIVLGGYYLYQGFFVQ